jgi:hypothetical protein
MAKKSTRKAASKKPAKMKAVKKAVKKAAPKKSVKKSAKKPTKKTTSKKAPKLTSAQLTLKVQDKVEGFIKKLYKKNYERHDDGRSDDEPDVDRQFRCSGEDRPIAADLLRQHFASLRPEVSLDEECDRPIADPDAGQRVGSQKATEDVSADALRNPGEDPLSEQRVAMPEERCEEVEGRELVDRRGRRKVRRPVRAAMRPGKALDVDSRGPGEDVGVSAPWTVRAGAPEPAEQSELDEPGQATLGSPQLSVDEQRRQLGGDDVGSEEPQQEVLLSTRESGPDGARAYRA